MPGRNTSKRLTIRDVAKAAGVSTQTVSRVINNHPDVAPDTFARVQGVIKGWLFPKPVGGSVTVTFPFAFRGQSF